MQLSADQVALIERPPIPAIFLEGPAGTGKTTASAGRLLRLLAESVPAEAVLLLLPQPPLAAPYHAALGPTGGLRGSAFSALTLAGLARWMVADFWERLAAPAGFARPDQPPVFLNLETSQYYLARTVQPLLDQGRFETLHIDRQRLYTQLLDNLNKASLVGFPLHTLAERLQLAWPGMTGRAQLAFAAQEAALTFRAYCLAHNLLDFSLLVAVFRQAFWPDPTCRRHLLDRFPHLIVENLEETPPVLHDLLADWLPQAASALLIYDHAAGFRRFLGADAESAYTLKKICPVSAVLNVSFVTPASLLSFGAAWLHPASTPKPPSAFQGEGDASSAGVGGEGLPITFSSHRYHPQMLDWVAEQAADLLASGPAAPNEIAILVPYLSDSLRFALVDQLERRGLPVRSFRPSRAWLAEPAVQCLLTLAALAHPQWGQVPARFELAAALVQVIASLDLVRAQLLAEIVYRPQPSAPALTSFDRLAPEARERITLVLGERFERLRLWQEAYRAGPAAPLVDFLFRLCAEVLSEPGYNFQLGSASSGLALRLIEAARHFETVLAAGPACPDDPGLAFIELLQAGALPARHESTAPEPLPPEAIPVPAIWLSPAYTFVMQNQPVDVQFWLDIGSRDWSSRLAQPLTHPEVLSRGWPAGKPWSDADEFAAANDSLNRLVLGLIRRCRRRLFLAASELDEQGYEQRGPLLQAAQASRLAHLPAAAE